MGGWTALLTSCSKNVSVHQLRRGEISSSLVLLNLPPSPVPSKGSESMIQRLPPNHPWEWQPHRAIASSVSPSDCSPGPFAAVIPKVNPPAAAVGAQAPAGTPLSKAPRPGALKLPPPPAGLSVLPGARGPSENQTHHRETLNFADARRTDKLAEHHVEPARESYPEPVEWEISWPLTNAILHSLI